MSGGGLNISAGTRSNSDAQVTAGGSAVTINAIGSIEAACAEDSLAIANNAFVLIQGANDVSMTSANGGIFLHAGNSQGSTANVITTKGGNISIQAPTGSLFLVSGTSVSGLSSLNVETKAGGNIDLTALNIVTQGNLDALHQANIFTGMTTGIGDITMNASILALGGTSIATGQAGGSIEINADGFGGIALSSLATTSPIGPNNITITGSSTAGLNLISSRFTTQDGNISVEAGAFINYIASTINMTASPLGGLSMIAGTDITFNAASVVKVKGPLLPTIDIVVDNNNPMSAGPGLLTYPIGAQITLSGTGFVRLYTADRMQNSIPDFAVINGLPYVKGPSGVDTAHEVWNTFYPDPGTPPGDGSDHFTIFFKDSGL